MRFLSFVICFVTSVSEAIDIVEMDLNNLEGKTVAYYFGSFDPFHKGHAEVVDRLLGTNDYVLLVPTGKPDQRKPNRTDPVLRRKVLGELYKTNDRVITTKMDLRALQATLHPHTADISFKGVLGTEILEEFMHASPEALDIFLQGDTIPEQDRESSCGAMMVVKAKALIVPLRDPQSPWASRKTFHDFTLEPMPLSERCGQISSSSIKQKIQAGEAYQDLVPAVVGALIEEWGLYGSV